MTYDPTQPIPTGSPRSTVTNIQVNFDEIFTGFSQSSGGIIYNHIPLNDLSGNQGKHGAVILENQPDPVNLGNQATIYSKSVNYGVSSSSQLFSLIPKFLPNNSNPIDIPNDPIQLTFNSVNITGPNQYQSFLAGRFLFYFGNTTITSHISPNIVLTPTPTLILDIQAQAQGTSSTGGKTNVPYDSRANIISPSNTFVIISQRAPNGSTFLWMAIGTL